ncbi:hypothetical protein BVX95_02200 [archaeon D22]|nr:hypothetical protein BVX95_02200 [archaeon D22]
MLLDKVRDLAKKYHAKEFTPLAGPYFFIKRIQEGVPSEYRSNRLRHSINCAAKGVLITAENLFIAYETKKHIVQPLVDIIKSYSFQ